MRAQKAEFLFGTKGIYWNVDLHYVKVLHVDANHRSSKPAVDRDYFLSITHIDLWSGDAGWWTKRTALTSPNILSKTNVLPLLFQQNLKIQWGLHWAL